MTIKEVAEKANVTSSLLSQIENNKANPSINSLLDSTKLHKLANIYDGKTIAVWVDSPASW